MKNIGKIYKGKTIGEIIIVYSYEKERQGRTAGKSGTVRRFSAGADGRAGSGNRMRAGNGGEPADRNGTGSRLCFAREESLKKPWPID